MLVSQTSNLAFDQLIQLLSLAGDPERSRKTLEELDQRNKQFEDEVRRSQESHRSAQEERHKAESSLSILRKEQQEFSMLKEKINLGHNLREASFEQREQRLTEKEKVLKDKEVQLNHRDAAIAQRENQWGQEKKFIHDLSISIDDRQRKTEKIVQDLRNYLCQLT